jgi:hypothetical protein
MATATYTEAQLLAAYKANLQLLSQVAARKAMGTSDAADEINAAAARTQVGAYLQYLREKGLSDPTPQAAQKVLDLYAQITALAAAFGVQLPG